MLNGNQFNGYLLQMKYFNTELIFIFKDNLPCSDMLIEMNTNNIPLVLKFSTSRFFFRNDPVIYIKTRFLVSYEIKRVYKNVKRQIQCQHILAKMALMSAKRIHHKQLSK